MNYCMDSYYYNSYALEVIKKIMDLFDEIISLTPNNPDNSTDGSKKSELNRFK